MSYLECSSRQISMCFCAVEGGGAGSSTVYCSVVEQANLSLWFHLLLTICTMPEFILLVCLTSMSALLCMVYFLSPSLVRRGELLHSVDARAQASMHVCDTPFDPWSD